MIGLITWKMRGGRRKIWIFTRGRRGIKICSIQIILLGKKFIQVENIKREERIDWSSGRGMCRKREKGIKRLKKKKNSMIKKS